MMDRLTGTRFPHTRDPIERLTFERYVRTPDYFVLNLADSVPDIHSFLGIYGDRKRLLFTFTYLDAFEIKAV
jgi:hypothetical protein